VSERVASECLANASPLFRSALKAREKIKNKREKEKKSSEILKKVTRGHVGRNSRRCRWRV